MDVQGSARLVVLLALVGAGAYIAAPGDPSIESLTTNPDGEPYVEISSPEPSTDTATLAEDTTATPDQAGLNTARVAYHIHQEINERRSQYGVSPINRDTRLDDIAAYHSEDMVENNYFAHESPNGESMSDRYSRFGYNCDRGGGENIAQTYWKTQVETDRGTVYYDSNHELAIGIVNQWMNSSAHRENILRGIWRYEGIGISVDRVGEEVTVYVTQNFC